MKWETIYMPSPSDFILFKNLIWDIQNMDFYLFIYFCKWLKLVEFTLVAKNLKI
jgi:hypothetical protein